MVKLSKLTPILCVTDLQTALAHYRRLGFSVDFEFKFPENERTHYAGVTRDGQTLHLSTFAENGQIKSQVFVTVEDIDALYEELWAAGVECVAPLDQS